MQFDRQRRGDLAVAEQLDHGRLLGDQAPLEQRAKRHPRLGPLAGADLQRLVNSPVFSAEDQSRSIVALIEKAKIGGLVGNFLKVVARNRRLFAVPQIVRSFHEIVARERGEVTADVTTAQALTAAQEKELKAALSGATGKTVTLDVTVDASLLGGLIVKIGSRQVDTSLRTKLSTLKHTLKEVG